jgi:hypothetical protein
MGVAYLRPTGLRTEMIPDFRMFHDESFPLELIHTGSLDLTYVGIVSM